MSFAKPKELRNKNDFYSTPEWCYQNLDLDWSWWKTAHEPCAGDHRITKFLTEKGLQTSYSEISEDLDYFKWDGKVDLILTNPPFSLAKEFIDHSLARATTVIMLLRINFLGSQKRYPWWIENEPDSLIVLSKRPSFTGTGTDATEYAWFVWDKEKRFNGVKHLKL